MTGQRQFLFGLLSTAFFIAALMFPYEIAGARSDHDEKSIGAAFHEQTSLNWMGVLGDLVGAKPRKPPKYKRIGGEKMIKLPKPEHHGISLEEAIQKRRSLRNFSSKPLSLAELSQLLFAAQGITGKIYGTPLRTAPSAGALYPFEIYPVVNNVQGIPRGVYHYVIGEHGLELIKEGDFRKKISSAGLSQDMLGEASVTFVMSAIFARTTSKYGERGYRYVYIEAGHISQNIALEAVSLGLGSVTVGAFIDKQINSLIEVDGDKEATIYLHAVGKP